VTLREDASWEEVSARLEAAGVAVLNARAIEASLEDVFLALVGPAEAA
jgi:hypothetical protein